MQLTIDFYKRNYIEGLFLSSGIIRSADYTMEQIIEIARRLREEEQFHGYIHLKTIPEASAELVERAGRYADRLSVNIELPTQESLQQLAPEKSHHSIKSAMGTIRVKLDETAQEKKTHARKTTLTRAVVPPFSPSGQSTQLVVGADSANDAQVLTMAASLYSSYRLKRVYYSAFSPIAHSSVLLPNAAPPLMREHRLYQADWLLRFYGFSFQELLPTLDGGRLDLQIDPKMAWALAHREQFPVDVNRATRDQLLRIPGIGKRNAQRLLAIRRQRRVRYADLVRLRCNLVHARLFVIVSDYSPPLAQPESSALRARFVNEPQQASLF